MSKCYYCNRETTICFLDEKGHSFCSSQCKSAYIQEARDKLLKLNFVRALNGLTNYLEGKADKDGNPVMSEYGLSKYIEFKSNNVLE